MERFGLKSEMPKIGKKAMEKRGIEYGGDEEQGRGLFLESPETFRAYFG